MNVIVLVTVAEFLHVFIALKSTAVFREVNGRFHFQSSEHTDL